MYESTILLNKQPLTLSIWKKTEVNTIIICVSWSKQLGWIVRSILALFPNTVNIKRKYCPTTLACKYHALPEHRWDQVNATACWVILGIYTDLWNCCFLHHDYSMSIHWSCYADDVGMLAGPENNILIGFTFLHYQFYVMSFFNLTSMLLFACGQERRKMLSSLLPPPSAFGETLVKVADFMLGREMNLYLSRAKV